MYHPTDSAPSGVVKILKRERKEQKLLSPYGKLFPTENQMDCINFVSYNYVGLGQTNDTTTPKSSKLKRLNSDSAPNKWQYSPEPVSKSDLKMNKYQPKVDLDPMETESTIICNHVEGHVHLSNKKALFYNMKNYYESIGEDPFKYLPLTFHIKENLEDPEFEKFVQEFERLEKSDQERADALWEEKKRKAKPTNIWIIKPGENTNRGSGIQVCNTLEQIKNIGK